MVIIPVSLLRLAMGAADRELDALSTDGSLTSTLPAVQSRADLYELPDHRAYAAFDASISTFDLSMNRS